MLQGVFAKRGVEQFTAEQLTCVRRVCDRLAQEPEYDDDFANAITIELLKGGLDVFREIE